MKYTSLYHINNLLQSSSLLNQFSSKIKELEQLKSIVFKLLPPELAKYCFVANLRGGVLVLVTKSPVWKHQINFIKMDLLEQLRKIPFCAGISSITITVDYLAEELEVYKNITNYEDNKLSGRKVIKKTKKKNFIISTQTALLINEIINQEIKDQKLLQKFKSLISKIS